jgi:hypothetical protein
MITLNLNSIPSPSTMNTATKNALVENIAIQISGQALSRINSLSRMKGPKGDEIAALIGRTSCAVASGLVDALAERSMASTAPVVQQQESDA